MGKFLIVELTSDPRGSVRRRISVARNTMDSITIAFKLCGLPTDSETVIGLSMDEAIEVAHALEFVCKIDAESMPFPIEA
jgi:hypothetical protein